MKLEHSFSVETRELFRYHQYCWKCHRNQNAMLEVHHICGRKKHEKYLDSPFNACVLCKECHDHVTHSDEERFYLYSFTIRILKTELYRPIESDILFLYEHAQDKFHKNPQELVDVILKTE